MAAGLAPAGKSAAPIFSSVRAGRIPALSRISLHDPTSLPPKRERVRAKSALKQ